MQIIYNWWGRGKVSINFFSGDISGSEHTKNRKWPLVTVLHFHFIAVEKWHQYLSVSSFHKMNAINILAIFTPLIPSQTHVLPLFHNFDQVFCANLCPLQHKHAATWLRKKYGWVFFDNLKPKIICTEDRTV